jgi:Na+/melibiose symporter-like transporter
MLLLARVVVAVGSAFAFVSTALLIGRWFSKDKFPILFGLTQCSGNISVVAANMFLPKIISLVHGWRYVSWYLSLLGFTLAIGLFLIVKTRPKAMQATSTQVTQSTVSISQLFKILLTNQQFWVVTLFAGLLLGSLFNLGANWDISFQKSFSGNTLSSAALINSIMFLGLAVGNPLMGILSGKLKSRRKLLVIGSLSAAILLGVLLFAPQLNHAAAMVLYFGFGLCCSTVVYLSGALMSLVISSVLQIEIKFVQNILFSDRVALSLFFFAILQAFTISLFIKESYKS